jgi:1-acyl-sn-glycerol-3-phosphate acyltransferase
VSGGSGRNGGARSPDSPNIRFTMSARATTGPRPRSAALVTVPRDEPPSPGTPRLSDVDEWGRSERTRARLRKLYDPIYRRWFRVEWEGLEHIPRTGGALLVANHAGAVPTDAPLLMHGVETELQRALYVLADDIFRTIPGVGTLWARSGGVAGHPDNAYRLLRDQQELVLVFPEGTKGTGKLYRDRYHLRRFGRGGFVEIAMRSGVPIVPISIIGSEEAMPMLARSPTLARLLRVPYAPLTANMLAFGPLGAILPFPAKFRFRVLPPVHFDVPPDQDRYPRSQVFEAAESIRGLLQDSVHDMLRQRRSVWSG